MFLEHVDLDFKTQVNVIFSQDDSTVLANILPQAIAFTTMLKVQVLWKALKLSKV